MTITYAELQKQAAQCPNVKVEQMNSGYNEQQAIANIQTATAQGVNAIVGYFAFGQAELPALTAAYTAGIAVVPFDSPVGGAAGTNFTTYVGFDAATIGANDANWIAKRISEKGNVVYLGGSAGNTFSEGIFQGFKARLKSAYPKVKILTGAAIPTQWTESNTQQVMAGLFARFRSIQGVVSDYGAAGVGALRAYVAAKKPMPPFATDATSNELSCFYLLNKSKSPKAALYAQDGTTRLVEVAFRKALAAAAGTTDPEASTVSMYQFINTTVKTSALQPKCATNLPPGADLSSDLSVAAQVSLLG
jgi:ribose transport system substrate-binding protein